MYKMVFNLYAFEGMKHREIAEELGISEGTSKSNLSDARVILQRAVHNSLKIAKQNNL
jgi:RNA polymerase sigma-70 factor (ECF subfamily)